MWTPDKSKTPERLAELKKIRIKYKKILSIIQSCVTIDHIDCCVRIVKNFETYCLKTGVHFDTYTTLVKSLKDYIKIKKRSIWLT
jgi:hypothetical protein